MKLPLSSTCGEEHLHCKYHALCQAWYLWPGCGTKLVQVLHQGHIQVHALEPPHRHSKCCATLNDILAIGCLENSSLHNVHFPGARCECATDCWFCVLFKKCDVSESILRHMFYTNWQKKDVTGISRSQLWGIPSPQALMWGFDIIWINYHLIIWYYREVLRCLISI